MMRGLLAGLAVLCLCASEAAAQWGFSTYGSYGGAGYSRSWHYGYGYQPTYYGSTNRIGMFEFHNYGNGLTGATTRIGQFQFHDWSDGSRGTTTRIGDTYFHDFTPSYRYRSRYGHYGW